MANQKWAVGVDVNVSNIHIAAVNDQGKVLTHQSFTTPAKDGPRVVIKEIGRNIKNVINEIGSPPAGVGVGMAGQIDPLDGVVYFAPNLNWREISLQNDLKNDLGLPVGVINDVRAVTWAEWRYGAGKDCNDLVYLYLSTGIGGSIITEGHIQKGTNNCAGEVGHMTVDINGPPCTCGNWGCLEAFAGEWAILRNAKKAVSEPHDSKSLIENLSQEREEGISVQLVLEAYRNDDLLAKSIINQAIQAVIAGSASIVNALNPERLILGGSLVEAFPELVDLVKDGLPQRALFAASQKLQVVKATLGKEAGVIGAATYALISAPAR